MKKSVNKWYRDVGYCRFCGQAKKISKTARCLDCSKHHGAQYIKKIREGYPQKQASDKARAEKRRSKK